MTTRCGTPVTVTRDVQPIVPDLRMDHVVEEHFHFVLAPCSPVRSFIRVARIGGDASV